MHSKPVIKGAPRLTRTEKTALGSSPASDGVLGKSINPKVIKLSQL